MMIAAGCVLLLQAFFVLNAAWFDTDDREPMSFGGHVWAAVLVVASFLGAFALFGWLA